MCDARRLCGVSHGAFVSIRGFQELGIGPVTWILAWDILAGSATRICWLGHRQQLGVLVLSRVVSFGVCSSIKMSREFFDVLGSVAHG